MDHLLTYQDMDAHLDWQAEEESSNQRSSDGIRRSCRVHCSAGWMGQQVNYQFCTLQTRLLWKSGKKKVFRNPVCHEAMFGLQQGYKKEKNTAWYWTHHPNGDRCFGSIMLWDSTCNWEIIYTQGVTQQGWMHTTPFRFLQCYHINPQHQIRLQFGVITS